MAPNGSQSEKNRAQSAYNLTLAVVASQVGCLTLIIVFAALFAGLWLDNRFQTRPMFTVGLIIVSVPITLVSMFWVVKATTSRLKVNKQVNTQNNQEEE